MFDGTVYDQPPRTPYAREASALPPLGVCPHCGRWIKDHDSDERKACHDALSGYRRDG